MATPLIRPEVTATFIVDGDPVELDVSAGKVTLDDGWSPYVQATFSVPLTTVEIAESIDPMETQRVIVEAAEAVGGTTRTFDLSLRGRVVKHKDRSVTVEAASDEALLIDKRRLAGTVDQTPRTYETSLRDVCDWALGKIGASLEAGTDDADLTAYWELTNLVTNPSYETNANDTGISVNASGLASVTLLSPSPAGGTKALRFTATGSGTSAIYPAGPSTTSGGAFRAIRVTPGRKYSASLYAFSSTARSSRMGIQFRDEGGNALGTTFSAFANDGGGGVMVRYSVVGVEAPPNASYAAVYFETLSNTASQQHYVDGVMLYEGSELVDYFDGANAPTGYTTAWNGDADASASTRTPDVERSPELFDWVPGTSLWDFLAPLLEASGLRLFCDETRAWRLVDPSTYEVDGNVLVQEKVNAIEGEDTVTRDDESWGTGVVAIYRWTDEYGVQQERFDYAGTDEKVVTDTYNDTPFPGPGAAAKTLARLAGKGRTQDAQRLVNYDATPGNDVTINLPGSDPQVGKLRQVIFDLQAGVMDIGTRSLTEATTGSWLGWDAGEAWEDVDAGLEWEDA